MRSVGHNRPTTGNRRNQPSTVNPQYQQGLVQAQQLLRQRRAADCLRLCEQLLAKAPGEVNALHLSALALQAGGEVEAADGRFRQALAAAPSSSELRVSYADFLGRLGRVDEAEGNLRRALDLAPGNDAAQYALALLLFRVSRLDDARRAVAPLIAATPGKARSWELAAAVEQKIGDVAAALARCRDGLARFSDNARLHYSFAQLLRQDCDFEAAAAAYARAQQLGFDAPDVFRNRADALLDAGDTSAALACARAGVERYPGNALLQRSAAQLHFSTQAPGDPVAHLYATARREARNPELWQALAELLTRLGREAEASAALAEGRRLGCPDTPAILALEALDVARQGDNSEAIRRFDALVPTCPNSLNVLHSFLQLLLTAGEPERAEAVAADILRRAPHDQMALAYRGTAWQLLGDPREAWLLDYERMGGPVPVPVPEGFADRAAFFDALRVALEELHHTTAQPIEQSVRGGTQTNGFLFRLKHPLLRVLEQQLRLAIVSAIQAFPDDAGHPFWARRYRAPTGDGLRFAGAWSVRLRSEGFHTNHIHPQGWISSALYVHLPEEVRRAEDTAGFIQFGQPMSELGIDLPPRRIVRPEIGTLVLFPSYMWHGTLPFASAEPRITVAFDLLPDA